MEKGVVPFSEGFEPSQVPYSVLRALSHKKYLDYVDYEVSRFEGVADRPRRWVIHDNQLFELWKDAAEKAKSAADSVKPGQRSDKQKDSSNETSQKVLTMEFFAFLKDVIAENTVKTYFEMCTGRQMNTSKKHRTLFNDRGDPIGTDELSEFERNHQGLDSLIELFEWIFMGDLIV